MATSGRTLLLFQGETATTGTAVYPQRVSSIMGLVQGTCASPSGKTFKLEIQGRIDPGLPWGIIATIDETDLDSNASASVQVPLFAEMQAEVVSVSGLSADDLLFYLQE